VYRITLWSNTVLAEGRKIKKEVTPMIILARGKETMIQYFLRPNELE
jgi:hypothetical protein